MSSSGLIYAVIVGAWAAYLVPMWLRRQDELNEARPTERFSTAIRLLSGRAGMERRYAKDLRARSADEGEPSAEPDGVTDSVDVRAFAMPPHRTHTKAQLPVERGESPQQQAQQPQQQAQSQPQAQPHQQANQQAAQAKPVPQQGGQPSAKQGTAAGSAPSRAKRPGRPGNRTAGARRGDSAEAVARARRLKVLARRRRTTVMLFFAFSLGAVVAAVGGLALLWAPAVPAVLLSTYIAHLRRQELKRFAYTMDRRQAEVAAQRLRERQPQRRRPVPDPVDTDEPEDGPENEEARAELTALAADRRALVEQTDHAEWVDQQRERQRRPGQGDSWDPVPVPLPTYVTAPVAPRATSGVDLGAPDAWSSARSSSADPHGSSTPSAREPEGECGTEEHADDTGADDAADAPDGGRSDARRAASARRSRERGRTPLFDQYEDGDRPRAANE
ncbi:divisome protein SepX/GlpR [Streptomyces adelaidensis]|uniref:divisome protein SepX/GlpR n=1 Tax=Streptomyces adelaidensis TaxID=2796465 RepID=UPI0019036E0A|nr:gephyrin-like molybdotransferase receptor GlpR [Streptomyces adelaidensis]